MVEPALHPMSVPAHQATMAARVNPQSAQYPVKIEEPAQVGFFLLLSKNDRV